MAEIVPHDTEYIGNCYSDEILAEMEKKQVTEEVSVSHKKRKKNRKGLNLPVLFYSIYPFLTLKALLLTVPVSL